MTHHPNLKIIAFVGMTGAGKSTAVHHFTEKGFPKVTITTSDETSAIDQIEHLVAAGQHRVIIDGIETWDEYKSLKHHYPSEIAVVAVVSPRQVRYRRLDRDPQDHESAGQHDYEEIETGGKAGPIAAADYYVLNDGSIERFEHQLDDVAHEIFK